MLNAIVFIFLVVAYVCIRIPILTGVQNEHISRRKDSVFLLKMFFLKLVFHDVGHLYAKCLFYIPTIYAKSLIYQFLSRGIRMHIPILTGVQNERLSKNAKMMHILHIAVFQAASNCFFRNINKKLFFRFCLCFFSIYK